MPTAVAGGGKITFVQQLKDSLSVKWKKFQSADNPDALKCKVCSVPYMVEKGSQFSLSHGFTPRQWLQTASTVTVMCVTLGASWALIQLYYQPWIRMLTVSVGLLIQYICLRYNSLQSAKGKLGRNCSLFLASIRSLGLNTVTAYQRAKVSALKIVGLRMASSPSSSSSHSPSRPNPAGNQDVIQTVQVEFQKLSSLPSSSYSQASRQQTRI